MHDDFDRLAWESLDGSISAGDRSRLEQTLARDEAARARFAELERLAALLGRLEPMRPPAELRPRIDRALSAAAPRWRRRRSPADAWKGRLAYLAAGLMIGLVAARVLLPTAQVERTDVVGSMAPVASAVTLDLDEAGRLAMWRDGSSRVVVELGLSAAIPMEVELGVTEGGLTLERAALSGRGEAIAEGSGIRLLVEGPGRSSLVVASDSDQCAYLIRLTSGQRVLAEKLVDVEELGGEFR